MSEKERPDHLAQIADALQGIAGQIGLERATQVKGFPWKEAREARDRLVRAELRANIAIGIAVLSVLVAALGVVLHF